MKTVNGLFTQNESTTAIHRLTENGFRRDDLSQLTSASRMPPYLEGDPGEGAVRGVWIGALSGIVIALVGSVIVFTLLAIESMLIFTLLVTAVGGVVGGYLGSLYSIRGETQTKIDVHEALEAGQVLLIAKAEDDMQVETAVSIMEESNGQDVEVHTV